MWGTLLLDYQLIPNQKTRKRICEGHCGGSWLWLSGTCARALSQFSWAAFTAKCSRFKWRYLIPSTSCYHLNQKDNGSIIRNQVIFYRFSTVLAALNGFVQWFAAKGVFRERVQGNRKWTYALWNHQLRAIVAKTSWGNTWFQFDHLVFNI